MQAEILTQPGSVRLWQMAVFSHFETAGHGGLKRQRRVLIVEDDFLVAGEVEFVLAEAGFDVVGPAATAEEAVRLAADSKPDLVIMDVRLAGPSDGIEAATQIYREHGIRSVFATAHSDGHTVARGKAANPLGWVAKPYSPDSLLAEINALLL
jgi:DNA-binding NarL/FixJ family response regulator